MAPRDKLLSAAGSSPTNPMLLSSEDDSLANCESAPSKALALRWTLCAPPNRTAELLSQVASCAPSGSGDRCRFFRVAWTETASSRQTSSL